MRRLSRRTLFCFHATPIAIAPIQSAFAKHWSDAETVNLRDDGLTLDRAKEEDLSEQLIERFVAFGDKAIVLERRAFF